jgi:hypothetical protein
METINGMRNKCIKIEQWKAEFKARKGSDVNPETFRKAWTRSVDGLIAVQKVMLYNDWCWAVFDDHDDKKQEFGKVIQMKKGVE